MTGKRSGQVKKVIENVTSIVVNRFSRYQTPAMQNYIIPPRDTLALPTGFRSLDNALGMAGLPYGGITELMSPGGKLSGSGAINIAARIASRAQRRQQIITIIDMSHSFEPWQAERCGLIAPHLLLTWPETVLDAITTLENSAHHEGLIIVVMGLVTDLLNHVDPDLLKTLLGRVRTIVWRSNSVFLFLTSAQKNDPFNPTNYPVGFPLLELADLRLWLQDETWIHKDGIATAYKVNLTVIKNSMAAAGKGADIRIKFSTLDTFEGISS